MKKVCRLLLIAIVLISGILLLSACDNSNNVTDTPNNNGECAHQYDKWSVTKEATCAGEGVQSRTCKECGYTETEKIEVLEHTIVIDPSVKATCTTQGMTEGKHCSVCNEIIVAQETIPEGHTVVIDESGKPATCTDAGWSESSHCSACNMVLSEKKTIEATGHVEATDLAKAATCTEDGLTEGKHCTICNYVFVEQNSIPATGHTVVVDAAVEANCITTGLTEGSHCSTCNTILVKQTTVATLTSHAYVSGECKHCRKSDPNYAPTYNVGETWTVDGQWEFSLISAEEHNHCSSYLTNYEGFSNEQIVMLKFKYKNIGYGNTFAPKISSITVVDGAGEMAKLYSSGDTYLNGCDHAAEPAACANGIIARMSLPYALNNNSTSITIIVSIKDSNNVTRKAQFTTTITPKVEEPEDKLEGCTINLGTSLPQTISYYTYSGSMQSSCSVTEVSFEVSGDDLYIYFTGRKTYDSRGSGQSDSCKIGWKLYDNNNNVIASGTAYTLSIATGEGFVKAKSTAYNCITAGGTYKLVLLNVN